MENILSMFYQWLPESIYTCFISIPVCYWLIARHSIRFSSSLSSLPSGRSRLPMAPRFAMMSFFLSLLYLSLIIQSGNVCLAIPFLFYPQFFLHLFYAPFFLFHYMLCIAHFLNHFWWSKPVCKQRKHWIHCASCTITVLQSCFQEDWLCWSHKFSKFRWAFVHISLLIYGLFLISVHIDCLMVFPVWFF